MKIEGHLRRWLEDACDMENEGDRVAWEQYQELISCASLVLQYWKHGTPVRPGSLLAIDLKAALKAAEGE